MHKGEVQKCSQAHQKKLNTMWEKHSIKSFIMLDLMREALEFSREFNKLQARLMQNIKKHIEMKPKDKLYSRKSW